MPNLVETTKVDLTDGRTVRVREYDDGSIRFAVEFPEGTRAYAITEAFLAGGTNDHAIIKVVPLIKGANSE